MSHTPTSAERRSLQKKHAKPVDPDFNSGVLSVHQPSRKLMLSGFQTGNGCREWITCNCGFNDGLSGESWNATEASDCD